MTAVHRASVMVNTRPHRREHHVRMLVLGYESAFVPVVAAQTAFRAGPVNAGHSKEEFNMQINV